MLLGYLVFSSLYQNNIRKDIKTSQTFYITKEITAKELIDKIEFEDIIINKTKLKVAALVKQFNQNIKPGKFEIQPNMTNSRLLNMFLAGNQTPTKITFNNIRTKEQLAGALGAQLLIDSVHIISLLTDEGFLEKNNLNTKNITTIFIPNTYEVYWTISPQDLVSRMIRESDVFWNEQRLKKAKEINLNPQEVITLASIVEDEIMIKTEKPIVAGLYLNRLKRGYLLQADPTLKFALNDFGKKRILNVDKKVDSPYNTYMYKGLPPGPIRIPEASTIDAVLNYTRHNYLYMCAKADFSGYHHFSKTLAEHNRYARAYHKSLNDNNIYK